MPKLVSSMFKVFRREKKSQQGLGKSHARVKGDNRSVLDADSFIFMPGGSESQYWGEIMKDEGKFSQQAGDVESRRKTHLGFVQSQEGNEDLQEVKVIISPEVREKDSDLILNGKVYNRRLSGTLVKAGKADLAEDEPVIRDYAFLLSARERLSQELSGRYVYDRLIRSPLLPRNAPPTSHQHQHHQHQHRKSSQQSEAHLSKHPGGSDSGSGGRKSPLLKDRRKNSRDEVVLRRTGSASKKGGTGSISSSTSSSNNLLSVNYHGQLTCSVVGDLHSRRDQGSVKRPLTVDSQAYSNLDFSNSSVVGSEYAMPFDALSWRDFDPYEVVAMREYRTIPPQDLLLGEKIGEGQFGDVHNGYLYPKSMDEIDVAIKTCKPDASAEDKAKFLEEAAVMCKFKHPNIIKLFGVVSHMDLAYIVMELAPHGQLRRYMLLEGSRISRLMLLSYIAQLASAMVHLEDMNYVHRDIAARNILVCSPQTIKLADFGLSRGLEDGDYYVASRGKLPIKWMAPESINFRRFTGLSDVWMFGVCCWEVLMRGVKPFVGIKNDEVISKIESGERLALPVECPAPLYALMNMCWKYDPLERPRFGEIEARIREIMEEEMEVGQMGQMSGGRRYNSSVIERDPEAPAKPHRIPPPASMARVPSAESPSMNRMHPQHPQQYQHHQQHHGMDNVEHRAEDLPPLPPRFVDRFRDLSISPPGGSAGGSPTPPGRNPQHQHQQYQQHQQQSHEVYAREGRHPNHTHPSQPPHVIPPYSVTTLSPAAGDDQQLEKRTLQIRPESPSQQQVRQSHAIQPDSPLGGYHANAHIPPPAILSQHPSHQQQQQRGAGGGEQPPHQGIYYSTPSEAIERKQQRVLTKDGVFISRDIQGSVESINRDQGVRPKLGEGRPISHASTEDSSEISSPALFDDNPMDKRGFVSPSQEPHYESEEALFPPPGEEETLKLTMGVVKSVKELSDKVHKSKPNDYVDFVKSVGLSLRDLLSKVDEVLNQLPQDTHHEVTMAQKVLSADMNQLVSAMKDAQAHYDKFLEQEYQKKMLKAAHVVAVNSKVLLDAVNSAKRKAHLMR